MKEKPPGIKTRRLEDDNFGTEARLGITGRGCPDRTCPNFKNPGGFADQLQVNESAGTDEMARQAMTKLEMVQVAIKAMGSTSSEAIASFIEKRFGVLIEPKFVPVYRASLLGRDLLTNGRNTNVPGPMPQLA